MRKLNLAGLAVSALCALSLVACGGGTSAAKGPVKIQVFVGFGTGTDGGQVEIHNTLAKEFNESVGKQKGIELEFVHVQYAEAQQKFTTMVAGGLTPDIVGPTGVSGTAQQMNEWLDITPYLQKDKYDLSDFDAALVKAHKYTVDGKEVQVGLPIGFFPSVMYYNEDIFDRAGLPYPPAKFGDPSWTYDKVIELARKMTIDKNGKTPNDAGFDKDNVVQYGFDGWDWAPWRMVQGKFGNPLGMTADYKKATMDSPEWKAALQFHADTLYKHYVRPNSASDNAASAFGDNSPLASNKLAMWEIFSWMSYDYENWDANFKWNVAAIPAMNGKIVAGTNTDTFAMTKSGKNKDKAWEVYKWLYSPEIYARLAKNYGAIPAMKSQQAAWLEEQKAARPHINWQVFLDAGAYADNPNNEAWVPNYGKVWDAMNNAMNAVIAGTHGSVDELTAKLNAEVQGYLDEYWAAKK